MAKVVWRNEKERKQWARRLQSANPGLDVVHPEAAGIAYPTESKEDGKCTGSPGFKR